jgi:NADH-quinone oxidoreductase subunit N
VTVEPWKLQPLTPMLVVAVAIVVVMLALAFPRTRWAAPALTMLGLAAALATLPVALAVAPVEVTALLAVDRYALLYTGLVLAATLAVAALSREYLARREPEPGAFWLLLLLGALGAAVVVSSTHFASFFLGFELLTIPLFALIAYTTEQERPLEAGVKYLVLAGASSAFLLFGMALTYGELGTMHFRAIALAWADGGRAPVLLAGLAMILTGIGFKLAVVPFHMWTPDVYQGAPAPAAAFVATVSKAAFVGLLVRFFSETDASRWTSVNAALALVAIASILAGNLLALVQDSVKRLLAYSSIAHLGYLLVAFLAAGDPGREAATFYVVAYVATTLAAFGIVTVLSPADRDADDLGDFRGLFWRRPALALAFTAAMLSLAGMPLTAGFLAKFLVLTASVGDALWPLALALVVGSAIGIFYYLRVIVALYGEAPAEARWPALHLAGALALGAAVLVIVWLGVYPSPLLRLIAAAVSPPADLLASP